MIRIYERTSISEHSLSSVAKSTTGEEETLEVVASDEQKVHSGILLGVSVSCDSEDFNVSIRKKSGASVDTVDEIFTQSAANKNFAKNDLYAAWINGDSPKTGNLYAVITNDDGSHVTGTISVVLTNLINRRFSRNR